MTSVTNSCTHYTPTKPLDEQLEPLCKPPIETINLLGLPYRYSEVRFKPLYIKDKLFDITLTLYSKIKVLGKLTSQNTIIFTIVDAFRFCIKGREEGDQPKEASDRDIDAVIQDIYNRRAFR
jgi:hypothetical protein